jgi:hypothetical protein
MIRGNRGRFDGTALFRRNPNGPLGRLHTDLTRYILACPTQAHAHPSCPRSRYGTQTSEAVIRVVMIHLVVRRLARLTCF